MWGPKLWEVEMNRSVLRTAPFLVQSSIGAPAESLFMPSSYTSSSLTLRAILKTAAGRLGMGVQFTKIGKTDQAQIDQYVQSHFFSNRKA